MADDDKTAKDDTEEEKVEEPAAEKDEVEEKAEEEVKEEAKVEESAAAAPAGSDAKPTGTDQQGRQLYEIKCSKCGNQTEVPFKPSGDRPVYCRDCFMQQKNSR